MIEIKNEDTAVATPEEEVNEELDIASEEGEEEEEEE